MNSHLNRLLAHHRALRAAAIEAKSGYRGVRFPYLPSALSQPASTPHSHLLASWSRLAQALRELCLPGARIHPVNSCRVVSAQVGVVKLMGRQSGFIATYASIASGEVDVTLIPEVPFVMDGAHRIATAMPVLAHAHAKDCIVVVAAD